MSLFDEYNVYVQDVDGKIHKYLEIGILAANGRSGLFQRIGLKSWIERNDYSFRSKKSVLKEVKELAKLIQDDGFCGIENDPLKDLPNDGVIDGEE